MEDDTEMEKALGLTMAIETSIELGYLSISLDGDNKNVIEAVSIRELAVKPTTTTTLTLLNDLL